MALHPNFPTSPYEILAPDTRWFPEAETVRAAGMAQLIPPLVHKIREAVKEWRDGDYQGASDTSRALLKWWFQREHYLPGPDGEVAEFRYYFAQREAVETVIFLYEVARVKDEMDLMRYDSGGEVSRNMFPEQWRRFVLKMATGTGKTKVVSLLTAWAYFHKHYEDGSELAQNFLIVAPNIIVLDRLRADFDGRKIFYDDPVRPENGFAGRDWQNDFDLTVHIQDQVRVARPTGNLFLTNIHRVHTTDVPEPSADDEDTTDYYLGKKPTGATTDSKTDLGDIVREVDELVVFNDEAHHIHHEKLAWFKSIQDIHHHLVQKGGSLALQVDVTATPKRESGAIFAQTVCDYPLVEAIHHNILKQPVIPDEESRSKLREVKSAVFSERYFDYLALGVEEWRKARAECEKAGKKAILFVMTDDTINCDDVAQHLQKYYPEFEDAVLVIHTNKSGEISEAKTGRKPEELRELRKQANEIDRGDNPHKAVVSVMMLKEGWDVRNVTTIVGLRAYSAKSNILPEQTLGRGLRKMFPGQQGIDEKLSVIGTDAFIDFVESIKAEGVELERVAMGAGTEFAACAARVEVDEENEQKDIAALDMRIPVLTPRIHRRYENLEALEPKSFKHQKPSLEEYSDEEKRKIVFMHYESGEFSHETELDLNQALDSSAVIGYYARAVMKDLSLVGVYDILYGKIKQFIREDLFDCGRVDLEDVNTLRNLSEPSITRTIIETFKQQINDLTVHDKGSAVVKDYITLSETRPFTAKAQNSVQPKKSVFNRIIGDSGFELGFCKFLEKCADVVAHAKNYLAVGFKLDYQNAAGEISNYLPDFFVKLSDEKYVIVETKGREDVDVEPKMERLRQWCEDVNEAQQEVEFDFVFVDEAGFNKYRPQSFADVLKGFTKFKTS